MAEVKLAILEPLHQAILIGPAAASVRLRGQVLDSPIPSNTLFFKWYSSLNLPPSGDPTNVALNQPTDPPLNFVKALSVGSHTVILSAKDQAADTLAALKAVQHAGFTGGPAKPGVPSPCVIHVFVATMVTPNPTAPAVSLSRSNLILQAKAPPHWDEADYQAVNRIQYRWKLTPIGNPPNRPSIDLPRPAESLTFLADPGVIQYQANLQTALGTGSYTLTLRVQDQQNPTQGHEFSRTVTITN